MTIGSSLDTKLVSHFANIIRMTDNLLRSLPVGFQGQ